MWNQLKQLAKHSAIYGVGNAATSLLSFLLVPLYTHYLTTAEFGAYSLAIIVYSLLSLLVDCGFTSSIGRYYFDDARASDEGGLDSYRREMISTAMLVTAALSALVALGCYLLAEPMARSLFSQPEFAGYLHITSVALFFRGLTVAPMIYLRVRERALRFAALTFAQIAMFLLSNILLVAVLGLGVKGVLYSLLASTAIYALLLIASIAGDLKLMFRSRIAAELFRFGLPFLPTLLMMWVIDFSDRYLLDRYATTDAVGIYSLGYKFGQFMMFIVTAFTLGWTPIRFKVLSLAEPEVVYSRVGTFYTAFAATCWLALSLFAQEVIALTSSTHFHDAYRFIAPVAFGYLLYGVFVLAATGVGVAKRPASIPLVVGGAALVNVLFNLLMLPRFGPMASAYATIIAYAAMVIGTLYFSQRAYRIPYEYGKCFAILAGAVALVAVAESWAMLPFAAAVLMKLVMLVLYLALLLVAGVFRRGELIKIMQLLSRFSPRVLGALFDLCIKYGEKHSRPAEIEVTRP